MVTIFTFDVDARKEKRKEVQKHYLFSVKWGMAKNMKWKVEQFKINVCVEKRNKNELDSNGWIKKPKSKLFTSY